VETPIVNAIFRRRRARMVRFASKIRAKLQTKPFFQNTKV
jgi:hypothetical protein